MLEGEDPRYLARRILRMAVEDIGLADPQAQAICWCLETMNALAAPRVNWHYAGGHLSGIGPEIERGLCRV